MAGLRARLHSRRRWGARRRAAAGLVDRQTEAMADTHPCPFCELIFTSVAELQFHISLDHPDRQVPDREY